MRNVSQLCLAANNILLLHKWNHAFLLLAIALAWKWQFPEDIHYKNKVGERTRRQLLNSVIAIYRDLSLSHRSVIWSACHWQITVFCSTLSNNNPHEQHTCNTQCTVKYQKCVKCYRIVCQSCRPGNTKTTYISMTAMPAK